MGKPFAEPNLRVHGLISTNPETIEYRLTSAGEELKTVVFDLGMWGQHWIETRLFEESRPSLLMIGLPMSVISCGERSGHRLERVTLAGLPTVEIDHG